MEEYTNYLAHHGIKGQRWGVRRYQNPDGTLTLAGRKRYKVDLGGKRYKISSKDAKRAQSYKENGVPVYYKRSGRGKAKVLKRKQAEELDKIRRSNPKNLSDKELREYTDRLRLENNYLKEVQTRNSYAQGKNKTEVILDSLSKVSTGAKHVANIKTNINRIKNGDKKKN